MYFPDRGCVGTLRTVYVYATECSSNDTNIVQNANAHIT